MAFTSYFPAPSDTIIDAIVTFLAVGD